MTPEQATRQSRTFEIITWLVAVALALSIIFGC